MFLLPAYAESLPDQAACFACHGEDGQSQRPEVPSLGGQPEYYVTIQLVMFRDKLRAVDVMNEAMVGASDEVFAQGAIDAEIAPMGKLRYGLNATNAALSARAPVASRFFSQPSIG